MSEIDRLRGRIKKMGDIIYASIEENKALRVCIAELEARVKELKNKIENMEKGLAIECGVNPPRTSGKGEEMNKKQEEERTIIVTAPKGGQWFVATDTKTGTVSQGRTKRSALRNLVIAIELYEEATAKRERSKR